MKRILVTGGSGYIGAHTVKLLKQQGYEAIVVDRKMVPFMTQSAYFREEADIEDLWMLADLIKSMNVQAVIHLAASHEVALSVGDPMVFYQNNTIKTMGLASLCSDLGVPLIFSSTSSIYGEVEEREPFKETRVPNPMNPYAKSKLACEWILDDLHRTEKLQYISLRYFNAAGADPEGEVGYIQNPASHVIPILMDCVYHKKTFRVFGDDYATPDGTCVRDYTHVVDIAQAHIDALKYLEYAGKIGLNIGEVINIGSGNPASVKELINITEQCLKTRVHYSVYPRRPGDPAFLNADNGKAHDMLGWTPKKTKEDMIRDAWHWYLKHNKIKGE